MKIEILLATMFFENEAQDYLDKMNIQTDIIVGNQCEKTEDYEYEHNGHRVKVMSRNERGVGKNRNTTLFASDADIIVFSDNDIRYVDEYKEIIEEYYLNNPKADMVIFNLKEKLANGEICDMNCKDKKAKMHDVTKFGTFAITVKREAILKNRIAFSLLFGGGAKYSCGEDTLFLTDCYKKGLNIYLCSKTIAYNDSRLSTWFNGINQKYIRDKGVLFKQLSPKFYRFVIVMHAVKHKNKYAEYGSVKKVICEMLDAAKND